MLLLCVVNTANFDQLIWRYGQYGTENGADHYYLSTLSPDAGSYEEHLEGIMSEIQKPTLDTTEYSYYLTTPAWNVTNQIQLLRMAYQNGVSVRGFNLSRYLEYLNTKSIDIAKVAAVLTNTDEISIWRQK